MKKSMHQVCLDLGRRAARLFSRTALASASLAIALALVLSFASFTGLGAASLFSPAYAYQEILRLPVKITEIAPGVSHEVYRILTDEGWLQINVIRSKTGSADSLVPLYQLPLENAETLSGLVGSKDGVVAAVNGDYFDPNSSAVLGRMIDGGKVVQTSNRDMQRANVTVTKSGLIEIAYDSPLKCSVTNGEFTFDIDYFNKRYATGIALIIFDSDFGAKSLGFTRTDNVTTVTEFLVVDGVIRDIRKDGEPFDIPNSGSTNASGAPSNPAYAPAEPRGYQSGSYVLHAQGSKGVNMSNYFKVGDSININLETEVSNAFSGISGGAVLVKDGVAVEDFSHVIYGEHPRTAVAVEADGTSFMLVTVDGRSASFRGIRQSELAEFLISIGAYNAVILDGGGSTEMIAKDPYTGINEIKNFLSDGSERAIYNGLGIVNRLEPSGVLKSIKITGTQLGASEFGGLQFSGSQQEEGVIYGLVGIPVELHISGTDTSCHPMSVKEEASFAALGIEGIMEGSVFTPTQAGSGTIRADVKGRDAYVNIKVSDSPVELVVREQSGVYSFFVLTEEGYEFEVPADKISTYVSDNIATFHSKTGIMVPNQENAAGYATFSYYLPESVVAKGRGDVLSVSVPLVFGTAKTVLDNFEHAAQSQASAYQMGIAASPSGDGNVAAMAYQEREAGWNGNSRFLASLPRVIEIPKGAKSLSFDVFGSGQSRFSLNTYLQSSGGTQEGLSLADSIDWNGWKTLTIDLESLGFSPENSYKINYMELETLGSTDIHGYVYFDNFEIQGPNEYAGYLPSDINLRRSYEDYKLTSPAAWRIGYHREDAQTQEYEGYEAPEPSFIEGGESSVEELAQSFVYMEIDNRGGLIRANNGVTQWSVLKAALSMPDRPVVIKFSSTYYFPDKLEMKLLFDLLEDCGKPAILVFRSWQGQTDIFTNRGVTVAELSEGETLEISEGLEVQIHKDE